MAVATKYQVYGLVEAYTEIGEHSFKVVLNPRCFKSGHDIDVVLVDSDRRCMDFSVKKWGRKLNVVFKITPETPDGVSVASIARDGREIGRFHFWIVK